MNVTLLSIDLAKTVFQICGTNRAGKQVFNRSVRRNKLLELIAQYPGVPVAMEACSGSNYWGRTLCEAGHEVKLIPPIHVKPFVKGNKNDRNDAFAISEAAQRPNIKFVHPRSIEQTDLLILHKVRERRACERTALINQIRGLLGEYGIIFSMGKESLKKGLSHLLHQTESGLSHRARHHFKGLLDEWYELDLLIKDAEKQIKLEARDNEAANRLTQIRGVAEITATAVVAFAGNGAQYSNCRHFSASLGLVPKEHSSGGVQKLGGITKRGNCYIRRLLVQCAWSVIRHIAKATDGLSIWARRLIERRGKHKTALAIANKLARIIWAMLAHGSEYKPA